jgi:predicted DNA-binding transcriptional regulator AlpA
MDDDGIPVKRGPGRPRKAVGERRDSEALFITRDQLAEQLHMHRQTTYVMERQDPDFPVPVVIGGRRLFLIIDVERYIKRKTQQARAGRRAAAAKVFTEGEDSA